VSRTGAAIVHYGDFSLLADCLDRLHGEVSEVVVVNHAHTSVPEHIKQHQAHPVKWDEPGLNLGFSRGVNRAFARLQTEFVLVLNPDTRILSGAVASLEDCLDRNQRFGLVGPKLLNPGGMLQTSSYRLPTLTQLVGHLLGLAGRTPKWLRDLLSHTPMVARFGQLDPHDTEKEVEMVSGACFLVRREALFDAGPFDPGFFLYYEEKDLCRRLLDAGWLIGFTPAAMAEHTIAGSASGRSALARRHRALGALRYYQRHGTALQRVGARLFLLFYALIGFRNPHERGEYRMIIRACLTRRMACGSCS
jgi:N-acetylglucosaminyl-diphospho-decaprenol L-rhamnosyltransferase